MVTGSYLKNIALEIIKNIIKHINVRYEYKNYNKH